MNPTDDMSGKGGDDRRLDLLVDGELGEESRRALLRQLDEEPDGWRRCALAFLESQCWRQEFGALVGSHAAKGPPPQPARGPVWREWLGTALAMAASFLVALVLGTRLAPHGTGPAPEIAAAWKSNAPAGSEPRQEGSTGSAQASQGPGEQWEMVTLAAPRGADGPERTIRLPAVQRQTLDQRWLESLPQAVPPEMLQAFQQAGHEIEQHRELVPVPMQDGRRLIVPVDQVNVHYVGRPSL
jgi:hypothetical protein